MVTIVDPIVVSTRGMLYLFRLDTEGWDTLSVVSVFDADTITGDTDGAQLVADDVLKLGHIVYRRKHDGPERTSLSEQFNGYFKYCSVDLDPVVLGKELAKCLQHRRQND